jgi:hypothetical protein
MDQEGLHGVADARTLRLGVEEDLGCHLYIG